MNAAQLIAAGRQLKAPFALTLQLAGRSVQARAIELLRLVPGRRVVVRLQLEGKDYLAKLFLGAQAQKYAAREAKGVAALQAAGVSTPALQAQARLEGGDAPVLLFEYLPQVRHLSDTLDVEAAQRCLYLQDAVRMMARLHEAGLTHEDCHLGNFLLAEARLYLVDGDAVRERAARDEQALQNLALFFAQLPLALVPCFEALFKAYCVSRQWSAERHSQAFHEAMQCQRRQRQRRFLKKIFRDCSQVKVSKKWTRFVALERQADSPALQALLQDPDAAIERGRVLKAGNSATVALVDGAYVVKRYNMKSLKHALGRCWRPSRAWQSWRNAQLLRFYGIATPAPVALVEARFGPLRGRAYFITEYVSGENALSWVEKHRHNTGALQRLAQQFARLFALMKALRLSHGDCKATNFLLPQDELTVIDLDSMQLHRRSKCFNNAFAKDSQRFLKNWAGDVSTETVMREALNLSIPNPAPRN